MANHLAWYDHRLNNQEQTIGFYNSTGEDVPEKIYGKGDFKPVYEIIEVLENKSTGISGYNYVKAVAIRRPNN